MLLNNKRILLTSSSFAGGGITSYAHEVINCFSSSNELFVLVGDDTKRPINREKATVHYLDMSDLSVENAKQLVLLINEVIRPNIIINSNAKLMSLVLPFINDDIVIVSVSHSLRYIEADIAGFNSKYADHIIALSNYNKEYLCKQFKIKEHNKVSVVYNFVNDIPQIDQLIKEKKSRKRLNIVYAGGTAAAKSPELVLNILKDLLETDYDFQFYFMGNDIPTLQKIQRYKSIKTLFDNDSRLIVTGRLPREEAEAIISNANIFLCPSRREGCPIAMLEAMRAGCVVITSDYKNACREIIHNETDGFIIPHNKKRLFVSRIVDIVNNHRSYYSIYDACRINYLSNFSFSPWIKAMGTVMDTLSKDHSKRHLLFSESIYKHNCKLLKKREMYNKYHMLFFESLKSAIPMYMAGLKHSKY